MYSILKCDKDEISSQFMQEDNPSIFLSTQENDIKTMNQSDAKTQVISSLVNPNNKKLNFKNFPKLLGNKLVKKIAKEDKVPLGIEILKNKRIQTRQSKIKIKDLQEVCKTDIESKEFFQFFVGYDFFIHALNSNKIDDPISLIPVISNYWAAANEPDKMISNSLMNKYFQLQ